MEAASEGEKKPKRQMKTPYQLETLEKTYSSEMYPSEEIGAELSQELGLSDRQLQMWFCHRRLKDKKDMAKWERDNFDSTRDDLVVSERGDNDGSRFGSGSGSGSGSSHFNYVDDVPIVRRYCESPRSVMEGRVIACVEAQLGEPLKEDGPILGMEFDELPPGAFGAPIVVMPKKPQPEKSGLLCEGKSFEERDFKPIKDGMRDHREYLPDEPSIRSDAYGLIPYNLCDSPVECSSANASLLLLGNGQLSRGYGVQGLVPCHTLSSQQGVKGHFSSSSKDNIYTPQMEVSINMQMNAPDSVDPPIRPEYTDASERHISSSRYLPVEKKRRSNEARIGKPGEAPEKKIRKELDKQDTLRHKREEELRREMEKQEREKRKEEERMMREKQRQEERFQREERRENERREKFLQKESLKAERRRQKEELRREKEEARLKAAYERATTRRIVRESMELIEDDRLELMELAASSKGLPSIISLDYNTMQNLGSFRDYMGYFPPKSVMLKSPFSIPPWTDSEENIGDLLMVWRFCMTFADVLGLWPFTLDEFVQAFHDFDSRLLGEIHIALLKAIIKDIEDVAPTPSTVVGANQFSSANAEGGHPRIVDGAYLWGFDICHWKNHINPLTWPEILRQFALSAGFGPQLRRESFERTGLPDDVQAKSCEDIVSLLRNGSAAENAVAIMQEKGFSLQRKSRHRLTPGTVKFAAYHVLSLEGSKGMNVLDLAKKIQKSGLRDLTTSNTPEASISVALSRDAILFERIAPSTYCVRLPFRKDPDDAEAILSAAREKIKRYENGFLPGENADDVGRRDEDSEGEGAEGPEVHDLSLGTPNANQNSRNNNEGDGKENLFGDATLDLQNEPDAANNGASEPDQGDTETDEYKSGEPWVQGLAEGEYSDLSVEERLNALVSLVGIANEGNSIRIVLEDRLDAANAIKKQMLAEAHLDKKRIKEESIPKFDSSYMGNEAEIKQDTAAAENCQSPFTIVDNISYSSPISTTVKEEPVIGADRILVEHEAPMCQISSSNQPNGYAAERSRLQLKSYIVHRAEEMYIYRSLPLGQDRRRNRYWHFVVSASKYDPGSGRIFVESPDGYWRLIDSEEVFDALLASLDTRGIKESHLHIMLQTIENSFKENIRRNSQCARIEDRIENPVNEVIEMECSPAQDSPSSTVSGSNSSTCEPSFSFRIELGKNDSEKKAALDRFEKFQMWMWKECFNSSTLCAMRCGEKRCRPLLGICDFCLDSCIMENDLCPSCCRSFGTFENKIILSERCEDKRKISPRTSNCSRFSQPLRISLLKALLTVIEFSVPREGLHSFGMENVRKSWGDKLYASLCAEDFLQILTEFETVIKRDFLSTNYETTEELLASSGNPGSLSQLPWIPHTTAAVALRLLELDSSISYNLIPQIELLDDNESDGFTKPQTRYAFTKNIEDVEQPELEHRIEKNCADLHSMHGNYEYKQGIHRGFHGRSQKRVNGHGRRKLSVPLTQILTQRGERTHQRIVRSEENRAIHETLPCNNRNLENSVGLSSRKSDREEDSEGVGEEIHWIQNEVAERSNSLEPVQSCDDDDHAVEYEYAKWGTGNSIVMSDEDGSEDDDNDLEGMGGRIFEGDVDMNEDSDENENEEGSTESEDSEDYSD